MLKSYFTKHLVEAGCDEAGRGCLAGPVFAAAVILPKEFSHPVLNDSKQLTHQQRNMLRPVIEREAIAYAIAVVDVKTIDKINILHASILAMHRALHQLNKEPQLILVDGNRFKKFKRIPHRCIIQGDALFASIAAASVLAKTYRDDFMAQLHESFPIYNWKQNKGYGTEAHRMSILQNGITNQHRRSFRLGTERQQKMNLVVKELLQE